MATFGNWQSLLYVIFKNGQYVSYPFFQDATAANILYIRKPVDGVPNASGTLVPGFIIYTQDSKGLQDNVYYVSGYLSTLAQFLTELNALSTQNSFVLYTGLLKIGAFDVVEPSIIINDLQCQDQRIYNVDRDETTVMLNSATDLQYLRITVSSDQTAAGSYFYT